MAKINYKIGIVGVGTVGGALRKYLESIGRKPFLYDKYKKIGSVEEVNRADIVFIAVPTPFDERKKKFDDSYIRAAFRILKAPKIIVIKSTVLPGTTLRFQKMYPKRKILFNPEFLREKNPYRDFRFPDRQVVGFTPQSKSVAKKILRILPRAPYERIMPATEAEMVKYFGNNFLSVKVAFANNMYDLCTRLGANYDIIKEAAARDARVGASHLDIWHSGYRGYGGKCFPKDIKALISCADELGVDLTVHKAAEMVNKRLMRAQGIHNPERPSVNV